MLVYYCDFCGNKLIDLETPYKIEFSLPARWGGRGVKSQFDSCSMCIEKVRNLVEDQMKGKR